jgi:WD40 repeat protein
LALGLVDGAIIILDLILGIEKFFLEKHPGEISALAFWEDKALISGSVDGRVNISDLEIFDPDMAEKSEKKNLRCQNCQDRRIPVAKVITSEFGIGAAVDIEGNCRFYDLVRFRKIAKISSLN